MNLINTLLEVLQPEKILAKSIDKCAIIVFSEKCQKSIFSVHILEETDMDYLNMNNNC